MSQEGPVRPSGTLGEELFSKAGLGVLFILPVGFG